MVAKAEARPVECTDHGPMTFDERNQVYACDCLEIPHAEMTPYFEVSDDVIKLTPPPAG